MIISAAIEMMIKESNQNETPYFSLETATWWFDKSSWVLALSLAFGFICTVLIVVTGTVKEHHWDLLREEANKRVAEALVQAAKANKEAASLRADAEASKAKIAEAYARVAEAELALEKIRLPRRLTAVQVARIKAVAAASPGTAFTMGVFNDQESIALSAQIDSALVEGGWVEEAWKSGGDIVLSRAPKPEFGFTMVTGLFVQADQSKGFKLTSLVLSLAEAIAGNGLVVRPQVGPMPANANNNAVKILVGQKEL